MEDVPKQGIANIIGLNKVERQVSITERPYEADEIDMNQAWQIVEFVIRHWGSEARSCFFFELQKPTDNLTAVSWPEFLYYAAGDMPQRIYNAFINNYWGEIDNAIKRAEVAEKHVIPAAVAIERVRQLGDPERSGSLPPRGELEACPPWVRMAIETSPPQGVQDSGGNV